MLVLASSCSEKDPQRPATKDSPPGADDKGGATEEDPAAPSDRDTSKAKKDICATLDYGHDRPNTSYFLQFDDDAAATEYSKGFLAANDITDTAAITRDERTLRLVGRVFEGFQKVFPRETEGMTKPPRVFAVQAAGVNAFAGYDERREYEKAPWIFWVHQPTIDSAKPDAELEALYAHELAHLILRNMLPATRDAIRTHYRVKDGKEAGMIGAVADDDKKVRPRAEELRTIGQLVGREAAFGTVPVSAFWDAEYQSMLTTLAKDRQGGDVQACQAADNGVEQVQTFYRQNVSVHDLTLELTPKQKEDLATLTANTGESLRKCYANVKKSLLELKIEDRSVRVLVDGEPASTESLLDPNTPVHRLVYSVLMTNDVERDIDKQTDLPTIQRLLHVVDALHKRAAEIDTDTSLPVDELRVFDLEEDADDAAVRILRAIGDDPHGAAQMFMGQLSDPAACQREIEAGTPPRYGRFIDAHNATCWRAWHSNDLANALESCPVVPSNESASARSNASEQKSSLRIVQKTRLRLRR
jgi:hypothetical protein